MRLTSDLLTLTKCTIRSRHLLYKYGKTLELHHIIHKRYISNFNPSVKNSENSVKILGIETSCDDTGAAIVNENGQILGEGYYSQAKISVKLGGVLPSVARKYHEKYIEKALEDAFTQSGLSPDQLTAVAATVKPGNMRTLTVGAEYGKHLSLAYNLPFIPIHHMEAHALTVRMENKVPFPFVVLLVSGGHCLLALCHSIDEFSIIGETLDASPGCILDKVSRRLKLRNLPGFEEMCGGKAIEVAAGKGGNPLRFAFPAVMSKYRDANFSFSGIETSAKQHIQRLEKEQGIEGGRVLPEVSDLCASVQYAVVNHLVRKTQRAMRFVEAAGRMPDHNKTLVISGGVASNSFLRSSFEQLCDATGYRLLVPRLPLCTDNGVMIAWNGVERWRASKKGVLYDKEQIEGVQVQHKSPLGVNISAEHTSLDLANPKWVKILPLEKDNLAGI